jgi:inosine-uridine nucleoside N-ribohydrolase
VHGNVYEPHTDGSAEWNAYWDPAAMGVVWGSSVPLTLVPLDGTNKVWPGARVCMHACVHASCEQAM